MNINPADLIELARFGGPSLALTLMLVLVALWRRWLWIGVVVDLFLEARDAECERLRKERDELAALLHTKALESERELTRLRVIIENRSAKGER